MHERGDFSVTNTMTLSQKRAVVTSNQAWKWSRVSWLILEVNRGLNQSFRVEIIVPVLAMLTGLCTRGFRVAVERASILGGGQAEGPSGDAEQSCDEELHFGGTGCGKHRWL
ncbi:uncharacterized protein ARMOST_17906 [Armillaria ostoyae]|uniref:Uncharacterized protein n=1 Tax=Armillaria ostoyae TaxID=47428 RepID=A0A284S0A6_ARMOS|nr:uncharacterized protein ARMOST_17906 [Armillaria ostoyae]